jgi:hypothetical protein
MRGKVRGEMRAEPAAAAAILTLVCIIPKEKTRKALIES